MKQGEFWNARHNRIFAHGGWRIGGGIQVRGHSLLEDFVGKRSYFELLCLDVLGCLPEPRLARWIESGFMCLSFPDPRIWCNTAGALAGSSRCPPVAAVAAGMLASDSGLYGSSTTPPACEFLDRARRALDAGGSLEEFLDRRTTRGGRLRAPGFSRPIARGDDRVAALERLARELGFAMGPYERLALDIDAALRRRGGDSINMLGYTAGFLLDHGFDATTGYRLYSLCVNAGVLACYVEAVEAPAGAFLPLQCSDLEYTGVAARTLPARGPQ